MNKITRQAKKIKALEICEGVRENEKRESLVEYRESQEKLQTLTKSIEDQKKLLRQVEGEVCGNFTGRQITDLSLLEYKYAYLDQVYEKRAELEIEIQNYRERHTDLESRYKVADAKHEIIRKKVERERADHRSQKHILERETV